MNYDEIRELWEERAAIREYLGGYSREEAEQLAWQDVRDINARIMENTKDNALA